VKIKIQLSEAGIHKAIVRLNQMQQNLRFGLQDAIDVLVTDGALVANDKYGGMATAIGYMDNETHGIVAAVGETNLIAEFGAGDATLPPSGMFENVPDTDVYEGAYSEQVGSGEYARTRRETGQGRWHFGGVEYTRIEPRMGLYNAKNYIEKNASYVLQEVIKL
jgi:hypothetical protein